MYQAGIDELFGLVAAYPHARVMLRDAPPAHRLDQVGAQLGVSVPGFVREMYARHDGAATESGGRRGLYLFPMWWEWMPLDEVIAQSKFPLLWLREYELDAFPFAQDGTGTFLACSAGQVEKVWVIEAEPPSPAWPDGSVDGLLRATCEAYRGSNGKYRIDVSDQDRMEWAASWQPDW